jgi:hypothetical protein
VASWPRLKLGEGRGRGHGGDSHSPAARPVSAGRSWGGFRAGGRRRRNWSQKMPSKIIRNCKPPCHVVSVSLGWAAFTALHGPHMSDCFSGLYSRGRCISSPYYYITTTIITINEPRVGPLPNAACHRGSTLQSTPTVDTSGL